MNFKSKGNEYRVTALGVIALCLLIIFIACGTFYLASISQAKEAPPTFKNEKEEKKAEVSGTVDVMEAASGDAAIDNDKETGNTDKVDPPTSGTATNEEQKLKATNLKVDFDPTSILILANKKNALPSTYVPENLVKVTDFTPGKSADFGNVKSEVAEAFKELMVDAKKENLKISVSNGYRSYALQKSIFASNVAKRGSEVEANKTSAKPGESEHQTGLAMDLTSSKVNYGITYEFGKINEGIWIASNSYKYGFIVRYPKGAEKITGYSYEPWHVRYVGKDVAKEIFDRGITLEEYLFSKL